MNTLKADIANLLRVWQADANRLNDINNSYQARWDGSFGDKVEILEECIEELSKILEKANGDETSH